MALIKCVECGKEVSDSAKVCVHCGHPLQDRVEEVKQEKKGMNKKILIPVGIVLVIALLVVGIVYFINRPTGLEAEAVKYVKQLEDIVGDVEVIDAVAFSYIPYGEEEIEYKFLIVYNGRNGEDFATFLSDPELGYIGNGYNGGSSNDDMQQTINNVNALSAQKTYLEYLIGEVDAIDREDAENNKEKGLIQLDVEKIK